MLSWGGVLQKRSTQAQCTSAICSATALEHFDYDHDYRDGNDAFYDGNDNDSD